MPTSLANISIKSFRLISIKSFFVFSRRNCPLTVIKEISIFGNSSSESLLKLREQ